MKPSHLVSLYKLAELGVKGKEIDCTTRELAVAIGVSQQTASRLLIEMETEGLITRERSGRDQTIRIASEGLEHLKGMHQTLKRIFQPLKEAVIIRGVVFTGLSEGSYYVGLEGYRRQFRSKLGYDPYPGTLNLRVKREDSEARMELESLPFVYIDGFANEKRSYGPAKCYKAVVNGTLEASIIIPIRAHYGQDVVELISPYQLRKQLKLKDGDVVRVKVPLGFEASKAEAGDDIG